MYKYDEIDQQIVDERVAQYRDQTRRYLVGELTDDEYRPLRLQNGLYIQRHAPMLDVVFVTDVERRIGEGQINAARLQLLHGFDAVEPMNRVEGKHQAASLRGPNRVFTLFDFSAKNDPVPTMLVQNHVAAVPEFLGQSTGFRRSKLKSGVIALGEGEGTDEVKYLHGRHGRGTFTFLGGHDPEDYQHMVGDPPTDLTKHKHSPGYRLILNNVLFPAAEKKKQRT